LCSLIGKGDSQDILGGNQLFFYQVSDFMG